MERKGKISLILTLFGILAAVSLLGTTRTFSFAFADTNFVVAECPVVSNGDDEESGKCPDMKTIQNEDERSGNEQRDTSTAGNDTVDEQRDTSTPSDHTVDEQSDTRPPVTSGPVNPFGP
jgi:hypothetical protein